MTVMPVCSDINCSLMISRITDLLEYQRVTGRETQELTSIFQEVIYSYYWQNARSFPWRETTDPYSILVSEIMLQQTQTDRVLKKYLPFLLRFPDFISLASADLKSILKEWQGLGYNRRAIALKEISVRVRDEFNGILPNDLHALMNLPSIGRSTGGGILAFAHNLPVVFIETNIRRVFINFFFTDQEHVKDREILPLIEQTLDKDNPRLWYYALMDYGAMLKSKIPNPNRKSAHYTKQSPFEGSNRQIRGMILKMLLSHGPMQEQDLIDNIGKAFDRVSQIIKDLEGEGFIKPKGKMIFLT